MVKLKFKEIQKDIYQVIEDGINTDRVSFENVGFITINREPKLPPSLILDGTFSGILDLNNLKEIVKFMEAND